MLRIEPERLGIDRILLAEIDDGVAAVHAFEAERRSQLVERHLLAIVFRRPAKQAQES